jgi:lysophospholipase L1-like esterase
VASTSRRRTLGSALVLSTVMMGIPISTASAAAEPLEYVALGDSSVSGTGVPIQEDLVCTRSTQAWPKVVAAELGAELTDVSCGGAKVDDFSGRQFGFVAPQYDALTADTDLVTLTIGGNDISLVQTALSCVNLFPEPAGISCKDRYMADGEDEISDAIEARAPKLGEAIEEIHRRSPDAEVAVAGYATYIREDGCHPVQPIWARDANYLQAKVDELTAAMREQALAHDATFVDLAPVTVGHDVCAAPQDRYIEGLIPTAPAAPLHTSEIRRRAGRLRHGSRCRRRLTCHSPTSEIRRRIHKPAGTGIRRRISGVTSDSGVGTLKSGAGRFNSGTGTTKSCVCPGQPATTLALANVSAGIGRCSRQVMAIGRSPRCSTYVAWPRHRNGAAPSSSVGRSRTNNTTLVPSSR